MYVFASAVQSEQENAVARMPANAKESTREARMMAVLDAFLGVDRAKQPHRFRQPPVKG